VATQSFAQQDCRTAHLKNSKCTKILGGRGFASYPNREAHTPLSRKPPNWWGGAVSLLSENPRSLAQLFGLRFSVL